MFLCIALCSVFDQMWIVCIMKSLTSIFIVDLLFQRLSMAKTMARRKAFGLFIPNRNFFT